MNKKAFNTSDYVVGVFIFVLVFMVGSSFVYNFYSQDSSFVTGSGKTYAEFNSTFAKYRDIELAKNSTRLSISNSSSDPTDFGFLNGLIKTAWGTISQVYVTFGFMEEALKSTQDYLFIPPWVINIVIAIITILIAFAIYRLIFQGDA